MVIEKRVNSFRDLMLLSILNNIKNICDNGIFGKQILAKRVDLLTNAVASCSNSGL